MRFLDDLDDLDRAATPGPWVVTPNGDAIYQHDKQAGGPLIVQATIWRVRNDPERLVADLELTAKLRNTHQALARLLRAQAALVPWVDEMAKFTLTGHGHSKLNPLLAEYRAAIAAVEALP